VLSESRSLPSNEATELGLKSVCFQSVRISRISELTSLLMDTIDVLPSETLILPIKI